jgi:hypothetical protein
MCTSPAKNRCCVAVAVAVDVAVAALPSRLQSHACVVALVRRSVSPRSACVSSVSQPQALFATNQQKRKKGERTPSISRYNDRNQRRAQNEGVPGPLSQHAGDDGRRGSVFAALPGGDQFANARMLASRPSRHVCTLATHAVVDGRHHFRAQGR